MLFWNKVDFVKLIKLCLPLSLRQSRTIAFLSACIMPLQKLHDETLYTMKHDGRKINLEKILNDFFEVDGYDPSDHEETKTVYIENNIQAGSVFLFQPEEEQPVFLEPEEVFLIQENETISDISFIVYIPVAYLFNEPTVRALIDKYRYIGKLYTIETY